MFLRPNLYTSYAEEAQMLPTYTKKVLAAIAVIVLFLIPFDVPLITSPTDIPLLRDIPVISNGIPPLRFLGDSAWLRALDEVLIFGIAALGLNILTGMAGQVSLGHAFFMGVGAYTGAVMGGVSTSSVWGWNLPIWIWLPGAGVGAAIVGIIVSPVAVRLRGLYLAIVTLGLVFVGIHMSNTTWGKHIAGDPGLGRDFPTYDIRLWKEETPLVAVGAREGTWFGFLDVTDSQKKYLFLAALFLLFVLIAKNIARTRTGRALQAIRDRDIAAEVMGVPEFKYKLIAFATSSFFAGVAGALYASFAGKLPASQFSLALSVQFIAILLIGGVGTVSGTIMGTVFVVLSPKFVEEFTEWLADKTDGTGIGSKVADVVISNGSDHGPVSAATQSPGYPLNVFDLNLVLYGVLIIIFLIFEPLGLYGIWIRIRNYWKRWPFSY